MIIPVNMYFENSFIASIRGVYFSIDTVRMEDGWVTVHRHHLDEIIENVENIALADSDDESVVLPLSVLGWIFLGKVGLSGREVEEVVVYVNSKTYYRDIRRSFQNLEAVWNQFVLDTERGKTIINGRRVYNPRVIRNELISFSSTRSDVTKVLMMSSQAGLGMPFQTLRELINPEFHVAEMKKKTPMVVRINGKQRMMDYRITKTLRVFTLTDKPITIALVNICVSTEIISEPEITFCYKVRYSKEFKGTIWAEQ